MTLSDSAAEMLRDLVREHRQGIDAGDISYGTPEANRNAREDLDELDQLVAAQGES